MFDLIVFSLVSGGTFLTLQYVEKKRYRHWMLKRLAPSRPGPLHTVIAPKVPPSLALLAQRLGKIATPKNKGELARTAERLAHAGFRQNNAVVLFYGIKLGLGLGLAGGFFLLASLFGMISMNTPITAFIPLGIGYMGPDLVLKRMKAARQNKIFRELPDALDLLEICLRAGLGLDYALYRVCLELDRIAPVVSEEFGRYFMEIRAGISRGEALENMAQRNGSDPLNQVVTVFLQSLKIGSDMAQAPGASHPDHAPGAGTGRRRAGRKALHQTDTASGDFYPAGVNAHYPGACDFDVHVHGR